MCTKTSEYFFKNATWRWREPTCFYWVLFKVRILVKSQTDRHFSSPSLFQHFASVHIWLSFPDWLILEYHINSHTDPINNQVPTSLVSLSSSTAWSSYPSSLSSASLTSLARRSASSPRCSAFCFVSVASRRMSEASCHEKCYKSTTSVH